MMQQQQAPQVRRASPEEQQIYNMFVGMCMVLLWDTKFMQTAIEVIRKANTTMEGVAKVAAMVAFRVFSEGKSKGQEIPASVVLHGGMEVIDQVVELSLAAGFEPMTDQEVEMAHYGAADYFRDYVEKAGLADPEQMEMDRKEIEAMQADGRLAGVMQAIQQEQAKMAPQPPMQGLG